MKNVFDSVQAKATCKKAKKMIVEHKFDYAIDIVNQVGVTTC